MSDAVAVQPSGPVDNDALSKLARTILHVAWMSIVLGLILQLIALAMVRYGIGAEFVRDLGQKISWSMFVCIGLAIGSAAAKTKEFWMGLAGLIAAPVAFTLAKMTHKSLGQALNLGGGAEAPAMLIFSLMALKAIEYGIFGWLLGRLSKRGAPLQLFIRSGFMIGLIFSAAITLATALLSPTVPPATKLIGVGVNELLFPIGCGIVTHVSELMARVAKARAA